MILKIAWRNIWRNKRRTIITATSIFFAVFFSVFASSMNRGIFNKMIDDSVNTYVGYAQIHQKGYWEDKIIDNSFELKNELKEKVTSIKGVDALVPRLESFTLASYGKITKSASVIGIDPTAENTLTKLANRISEGEYIVDGEKAVMLGDGLAKKLKISVGDSIVLISQGYRGVNAAQIYPVKGILSFGAPNLSTTLIYMPLSVAQNFYGAPNLISSLVLDIDNKNIVPGIMQKLNSSIDTANTYETMAWEELIPDIVDLKSTKAASNIVVIFILYLIVGFGVFGVILMMTKERKYEFGVLLSVGMKRSKLALSVWIETMLLGIVGALVAIIISYGLCYYLMVNPIVMTGDAAATYIKFGMDPVMPTSVDADIFYTQALVVLCMTTLLALYPATSIWKMKPVDAMRG